MIKGSKSQVSTIQNLLYPEPKKYLLNSKKIKDRQYSPQKKFD